MKQILPKLKELDKHLSFAKKAFTKNGFRHATQYINGLITLNKKTVKQISRASIEEKHHSAVSRILTEAHFKQELLEQRYLKKIKYICKGQIISLLFDDTLVEREGKKIEETQFHKDHCNNGFVMGHQFFTALIHTPILQLPLFPKLYSKNTDSKIEMARDLIDQVVAALPLHTVLFDSWYSDKKLINKCTTKRIKVVCGIKTNRKICKEKGVWESLSKFSKNVSKKDLQTYFIDEIKYKIATYKVKLKGIPKVKMLVSHEWNEKKRKWNDPFHLISTNVRDTTVQIIRQYRIRWFIETYHRDIKQNLGFAQVQMRKKEGIVRHTIFVSLAYAILKMFMFLRGMTMTIGECCAYVQDKGMDDFIREIIEIDSKEERINFFQEVFISRTAKV
ncbi:transposase [Patescibacteria group bacterium]|nr:transposase [Patescibacteria group bacterium]